MASLCIETAQLCTQTLAATLYGHSLVQRRSLLAAAWAPAALNMTRWSRQPNDAFANGAAQ